MMKTATVMVPASIRDLCAARAVRHTGGATALPAIGYWRPDGGATERESVVALRLAADPHALATAVLAVVRTLAIHGEDAVYLERTDGHATVRELESVRSIMDGSESPLEPARTVAPFVTFIMGHVQSAECVARLWGASR